MFANASRLFLNGITTGPQLFQGTHFAVALAWLMTLVDGVKYVDAVGLYAHSDKVAVMVVIAFLVDFGEAG